MPQDSARLFEFLASNIAAPPFHQWLQPELVSVDEGTKAVTLRLAVRPSFLRASDHPAVHGGIVAALVDMAGHAAVAAQVGHGVPTIDLRVDYLRRADAQVLLARGAVLKLGRSIAVADVRVTDETDRLLAVGRGAYSSREG